MNAVEDAIERVKEADQVALRAQLAFAVGKFAAYWESQANAAIERLEASYEHGGNGTDAG